MHQVPGISLLQRYPTEMKYYFSKHLEYYFGNTNFIAFNIVKAESGKLHAACKLWVVEIFKNIQKHGKIIWRLQTEGPSGIFSKINGMVIWL